MKLLFRGLLLALVIFAIWAGFTYPKVGKIAFQSGAALESRLYGFTKSAVDIGDMELVTYQGGPAQGQAIIMLHGYTADKDVWPRFAKHFVDKYRVVIPDLAGHGESEFNPDWDYSIASQAARVAALMDALGIQQAHITGNSMGGYITAYFAVHYPEKTLSAAPIDPAGVVSPEPSDMQKELAKGNNPFLLESLEDFAEFYPMTMAKAPWLPGFVLDAMAQKYLDRRERHAQIFADFHDSSMTEELSALKAPALLMWGDQDRLLHVSSTQVWAAQVPQLRVEILPGIGHMPMVEVPKQSATIYQEFLSSL